MADTAADICNVFFRGRDSGGTGEGSLFTHAGPIWQELHLEFCTIRNIANTGNAGNPWGVGIPVPGVSENFVPKSVSYCDDGTS